MDARSVRTILADELAAGAEIRGGTGISGENIATFLVGPYPLQASAGAGNAVQTDVWVVLEEQPCVAGSALVAWDPAAAGWTVLESDQEGRYRIVERAASFAEAVAAL
jgi:hypothetical protein